MKYESKITDNPGKTRERIAALGPIVAIMFTTDAR
jgi:hypothetical protein